jgi:hypothetical protein
MAVPKQNPRNLPYVLPFPYKREASVLAQRKTIEHQGRKVEAEVLEFEAKTEGWNQYALEDGTSLKMKVVLLEVARLIGEYDAKGEPIYTLTAQQITGITAPDSLKKKV